MPATYDDANLVMQIVRWGTEMGLTDAVLSVLADEFAVTPVAIGRKGDSQCA